MNYLIRHNLPSLRTNIKRVTNKLFDIIQSSNADKDTVSVCMKALASVLHGCDYFELNQEQLKVLVDFLAAFLDRWEKQNATFTLLKV
jgi:hypothetical protein